jgi:hypothetical protein
MLRFFEQARPMGKASVGKSTRPPSRVWLHARVI